MASASRTYRREVAGRLPQPPPVLVVAGCFVAGVALARLLAARAHAHPR